MLTVTVIPMELPAPVVEASGVLVALNCPAVDGGKAEVGGPGADGQVRQYRGNCANLSSDLRHRCFNNAEPLQNIVHTATSATV